MAGSPLAKLFGIKPKDRTAENEWKPSDHFIKKHEYKWDKQCQKLDNEQVENDEGGYVYKVDDLEKLNRFLQFGTDQTNKYNCTEQFMLRKNASCIDRLITDEKGGEVVKHLKNASNLGETPKVSLILFALAICARSNDKDTKKAAYGALNDICRIPTHLFLFIRLCDYVQTKPLENDTETNNTNKQQQGPNVGWGRAHKRAICAWYEHQAARGPLELARLLTKYRRRSGWTHRDVFRQAHIKPKNENLKVMARYFVKNLQEAEGLVSDLKKEYPKLDGLLKFLQAIEELRACTDQARTAELVLEFRLEREHVHTSMLQSKTVWEALTETMKMGTLLKHLNKLTTLDLLKKEVGGSTPLLDQIRDAFTKPERLKEAKIHPFAILQAHRVYSRGQKLYHEADANLFKWYESKNRKDTDKAKTKPTGEEQNKDQAKTMSTRKNPKQEKKDRTWVPDKDLLAILETSMYMAFDQYRLTRKRCLVAIDVDRRGSAVCFGNSAVTPLDAAAAFALMMLKQETEESPCLVVTFSEYLKRLNINKDSTLENAINTIALTKPGLVDCALPMSWATKKQVEYDVFIVITANQTSHGIVHPSKALARYNAKRSKKLNPAKLVVIATAVNDFTIAAQDPTMMDVVGFDWKAFKAISDFIEDNA